MSSSTITFLFAASKQMIIYSGLFCFSIGIIGGLFNILVFLSLKIFRENPCAFYLTMMSIANTNQIIIVILGDIISTGYNIDWSQKSIIYCKMRPLLFHVIRLSCSTCLCLATIDKYLSTCLRPHWQRWSNTKLAHRLTAIYIFLFKSL